MIDFDDFIEEPEDYEPPNVPDEYFLKAQESIKKLYESNKEGVYYLRQLQVMFEKKYFRWITNNALIGLIKIGFLKDHREARETGTSTRYFMHKSNRYPLRQIKNTETIIREYSQDHITKSCGHRAEDLFVKALAFRGFLPLKAKVKEFEGKKWTKTNHDLDFLFNKDGVNYGCEIKNTLGYIEKKELEIKLEMCSFLGIIPLFIMRYSPKTYNYAIYKMGGFALIFETQIYELSQEALVKKMQHDLGLPVLCSKAIPDGIIDRLERWHDNNRR